MKRNNHYEAAFEAFIRDRGLPYVAVDESKKAMFNISKLKSFDFVVYSRSGPNLLIDIKGRKAEGEGASLQTWTTRQDVDDLLQWERIFGDGFCAIFAFIYWIDPVLTSPPGHFVHRPGDDRVPNPDRERHYLMFGVNLLDYRNHMNRRSVRWDTVSVPSVDFRQMARPIEQWL